MVKNPSVNAGDVGWVPFGGTKIPHAVWRLSPQAAATEAAHHKGEAHMKILRANSEDLMQPEINDYFFKFLNI